MCIHENRGPLGSNFNSNILGTFSLNNAFYFQPFSQMYAPPNNANYRFVVIHIGIFVTKKKKECATLMAMAT